MKHCTFIGREDGCNVFFFECACGGFGEVGVPDSKLGIVFQHDCGALYIERPAVGMFGEPSLIQVTGKGQA